jgi:hypothetical protein
MAVENDYNLLVHNLNELAKTLSALREEVERRRLREAREKLALNETYWRRPRVPRLRAGVLEVLDSQRGEAVFTDRPPSAPDAP